MVEERHGGRPDLGEVQRSLLHLKLNLNEVSETNKILKEGVWKIKRKLKKCCSKKVYLNNLSSLLSTKLQIFASTLNNANIRKRCLFFSHKFENSASFTNTPKQRQNLSK
jgi:hypothetical protein